METFHLRGKVSSLFPHYSGPGWSQRLVFLALALFIGIFETVFLFGQNMNSWSIWTLLPMSILLASCGWFAPWSEVAFVIIFDCCQLTPLSNQLTFYIFGVCAISVSWIARSWSLPGLVIFFTTELFVFVNSTTFAAQVLSFALDTAVVVPLGFLLQRQKQQMEKITADARKSREEAQEAGDRIRRQLAADLHDTIAKDLVRLVVLSDRLAKRPDTAEQRDFELLFEISSDASRRIRPLILNLDATREKTSFSKILNDVSRMLSTRSMVLEVEPETNFDLLLTPKQLHLASLIVQEAAINALKYGPIGALVTMNVELDENRTLEISMRNPIAETPEFTEVTSGFGLRNLESRLNEEDGELFFGKDSEGWIITAIIPPSKEEIQ